MEGEEVFLTMIYTNFETMPFVLDVSDIADTLIQNCSIVLQL